LQTKKEDLPSENDDDAYCDSTQLMFDCYSDDCLYWFVRFSYVSSLSIYGLSIYPSLISSCL